MKSEESKNWEDEMGGMIRKEYENIDVTEISHSFKQPPKEESLIEVSQKHSDSVKEQSISWIDLTNEK